MRGKVEHPAARWASRYGRKADEVGENEEAGEDPKK